MTIIFEVLLISILILVILLSPTTWGLIQKLKNKTHLFLKKETILEKQTLLINELNISIELLINLKKGATFIVKKDDEINEFIVSKEDIDANINSNLIVSIFDSMNSPFHDGAIIVENTKIKSASAYISKLSNKTIPKKLGTRHRSALGLSEVTDAIIVTVSEESGTIHIFYKGEYEKILLSNFFEKMNDFLIEDTSKKGE